MTDWSSLQSLYTPMDAIALVWFIFAWTSYARFSDTISDKQRNLLSVMNQYRIQWMREMLKRENRMMDSTMVGNLLRSIAFFASTTIFILLGLMTMLGYHEKAEMIIKAIPFADTTTPFMWEFKVVVLLITFILAFFKYTWSMRQYNYAGILVAAAPPANETEKHEDYARRAGRVVSNAAKHFNQGLRAYYFGLAVLAWFINSWMFLLSTTLVVLVIYRREFRSHTLNNLAQEKP